MNLEVLRQEIEADEGIKNETYHCSEGHLTGGIGHLITEWDEEYYGKPLGSSISEEQVQDWFARDVQQSINDCISLFDNFDKLPEDIQHVLTNMSFQLGRPRLSKFKKMIAAVHEEDYRENLRPLYNQVYSQIKDFDETKLLSDCDKFNNCTPKSSYLINSSLSLVPLTYSVFSTPLISTSLLPFTLL